MMTNKFHLSKMVIIQWLIILYVASSIIGFVYVWVSRDLHAKSVFGDKKITTIYGERNVYYDKGMKAYKLFATIHNDFFGNYNVDISLVDLGVNKTRYESKSIVFIDEHLFLMRTQKLSNKGFSNKKILSEDHMRTYPKPEYYLNVYSNEDFMCNMTVETSAVQCFSFVK